MPQAARAGGVFPAGSPLNTEMIPGAGSSSVDLQLVSADLFPPRHSSRPPLQLTQWLCPKVEKAEREKQFRKVPLSPSCESSD